jgi:hypothetical protein
MNARTIRWGLAAVAAAGAVSVIEAPGARAQSDAVERIVVTTSRSTRQRPTLGMIEGIREHVVDCLSRQAEIPRGAPDVSFLVRFKSDGTLDGPPAAQPEPTGLGDDDYMRAVSRARQALYRCEPYDFLPASEYQHWEEIVLVFRAAP